MCCGATCPLPETSTFLLTGGTHGMLQRQNKTQNHFKQELNICKPYPDVVPPARRSFQLRESEPVSCRNSLKTAVLQNIMLRWSVFKPNLWCIRLAHIGWFRPGAKLPPLKRMEAMSTFGEDVFFLRGQHRVRYGRHKKSRTLHVCNHSTRGVLCVHAEIVKGFFTWSGTKDYCP